MTARIGGAFGRGYTSTGESVVETVAEARTRAQQERVREMAKQNRADKADEAFSATPGARAPGVHAVEEPLRVGPRDALIEDGHNDGDYVPDIESKGYHVGMVRQPVTLAADAAGRVVGFTSEHPSKFAEQPTLADAKAYHNAVESSDEWNEDVQEATSVASTPEEAKAALAARKAATKRGSSKAAKADDADDGSADDVPSGDGT